MGVGCLPAQLDEPFVTAALECPDERAVLAEDLERVLLAGQLAALERLPGQRLACDEVALGYRPGRDCHLRDPAQRRLSESRGELLQLVARDLRPREIARLVAEVLEEEVGPELERTILRRLRAGEQVVGQVRSHGDHVGARHAVERVMQHACSDPRIADVARQRDRLGGQRLPPGAVVLVEQLLRLERQELRPPPGIGAVVELERALDRVDPLVVQVADEAREAAGVGERGGGGQIGVAERRRDLCGVQQRRAVRRVAGQLLRLAQPDQRPAALRVLDRAEQVERVGEQLRRLRRSEAVERAPPRRAPSS